VTTTAWIITVIALAMIVAIAFGAFGRRWGLEYEGAPDG